MNSATTAWSGGGKPRVAIIGAGGTGIGALRQMLAAGFDATVYEGRKELGGTWVYCPDPGEAKVAFTSSGRPLIYHPADLHSSRSLPPTAIYDGLRTNTPSQTMGYHGRPLRPDVPMFPSWREITEYVAEQAEDLRAWIRTGVKVMRLQKEAGGWTVHTCLTGSSERDAPLTAHRFDFVLVASGHYAFPYTPFVEGLWHFKGKLTHARWYRGPEEFANEKVLLVGKMGSGMDISRHVAELRMKLDADDPSRLHDPHRTPKLYQSVRSKNKYFSVDDEGVPPFTKHFSIVDRVSRITPSEDGKSLGLVHLVDGTVLDDVTCIVFATGYLYDYPFCQPTDAPFDAHPLVKVPPLLPHEEPISQAFGRDLAAGKHPGLSIMAESAFPRAGRRVHHLDERSLFYLPDPTLAFLGLHTHIIVFLLAEVQARAAAHMWLGKGHPALRALPDLPLEDPQTPSAPEEGAETKTIHLLGYDREPLYYKELLSWPGMVDKEAGNDWSIPQDWRWEDRVACFRSKAKLLGVVPPTARMAAEAERPAAVGRVPTP